MCPNHFRRWQGACNGRCCYFGQPRPGVFDGEKMRQTARCVVLAFALSLAGSLAAGAAFAQGALRIGLGDDPDVLAPTFSRTYTPRTVFASLCDKLFDIDEKPDIVPHLALGHET